jgi:hypothetical protein
MNEGQILHNQTQKSHSSIVQRLLRILILLWIIAGTLLPLIAFLRTEKTIVLLSLAFLVLPISIFSHDKKLFHRRGRKEIQLFEVAFITVIMLCISLLGLPYMSYYRTSTQQGANSSQPNLSPTSHPAAASPYPQLAPSYSGTLVNLSTNVPSQMTLTQMQQNGGQIAGSFNAIHISAPYTGFLDTSRHIFFTVAGSRGNAPLYFQGSVQQKNGTLSGSFCAVSQDGQCIGKGVFGLWNIAPVTSRYRESGYPN